MITTPGATTQVRDALPVLMPPESQLAPIATLKIILRNRVDPDGMGAVSFWLYSMVGTEIPTPIVTIRDKIWTQRHHYGKCGQIKGGA